MAEDFRTPADSQLAMSSKNGIYQANIYHALCCVQPAVLIIIIIIIISDSEVRPLQTSVRFGFETKTEDHDTVWFS